MPAHETAVAHETAAVRGMAVAHETAAVRGMAVAHETAAAAVGRGGGVRSGGGVRRGGDTQGKESGNIATTAR